MNSSRICKSALGHVRLILACAAIGLVGSALAQAPELSPVDVVISGGSLFDGGTGAPHTADVAIAGDRIVYVGVDAAKRYRARTVIDARGMIVAPGFIDAHTHPDTYVRSDDPKERLNAPWLFQGVSTLMIGGDGGGTPDVGDEAAWFKQHAIGTNLAPYVGFGAVRKRVLNMDARAPDAEELKRMEGLVAKGMCEGAFGFSTGLFYAPQSFSKTDEVIALAREAARRGGIYDSHIRDESSYTIGLLGAIKEAIQIGHDAGLPAHISHIKALGVDVHGDAGKVIALIDAARKSGQDVTADQYPWLASGTNLQASLVPRWAVAGGRKEMLHRFDDAATLQRIKTEMRENLRRRGGSESLLLTRSGHPWTGKTLKDVAAEWRLDAVDAAVRLIRETDGVSVASFNMDDADVRQFMKQPWVITSSDGSNGHPRQYATFPEKYVKYVKDEKAISLIDFIHRSTGLSAEILGLKDRGYLRKGYFADVVVFDPARYAPKADYVHPRVLSAGVVDLLVNGQPVIAGGKLTNAAPGRLLLHTPTPGTCSK
ncbi:MAG: amidohydrolase family protein [Xanthomonadales bacterium]|nr:amidohydrolase family protein [Xanthomonadales bacterium]